MGRGAGGSKASEDKTTTLGERAGPGVTADREGAKRGKKKKGQGGSDGGSFDISAKLSAVNMTLLSGKSVIVVDK